MDPINSELKPKFNADGLMPAIIQDAATGQVLMLAWMNAEAYERTVETGETHFWSRSRNELWHKGATSGNTQKVVEMAIDCDEDTLLVRVQPAGPACHTGEQTCFYRDIARATGDQPAGAEEPFGLETLFATILQRREHPTPGSYTSQLFSQGEDEIVKKVGEEAIEVVLAAKSQSNERLIEEAADLAYHTLVLLASHGLSPQDVIAVLGSRHKKG